MAQVDLTWLGLTSLILPQFDSVWLALAWHDLTSLVLHGLAWFDFTCLAWLDLNQLDLTQLDSNQLILTGLYFTSEVHHNSVGITSDLVNSLGLYHHWPDNQAQKVCCFTIINTISWKQWTSLFSDSLQVDVKPCMQVNNPCSNLTWNLLRQWQHTFTAGTCIQDGQFLQMDAVIMKRTLNLLLRAINWYPMQPQENDTTQSPPQLRQPLNPSLFTMMQQFRCHPLILRTE